MDGQDLDTSVADRKVYDSAIRRFREARILLPTFDELTDPSTIPARIRAALADVDPDEPHPLNLFRVHWYNDDERTGQTDIPPFIVLPCSLTGVSAPIVMVLGDRFPMIGSHKVLAAYGCLAPRIVSGRFDPAVNRAVWPSTGNYCRGGVAISRIMGCRGVAVLPEGMSRERFDWLDAWVGDPADVVRTPGSESNVKEIYDKTAELARDPACVVFNQFCEFGNYLVHHQATAGAIARIVDSLGKANPGLRLAAFVCATGSAGTLAAGDKLKQRYGSLSVAAEALECPTMLYNGFGEHNIQGIGDKHIPLIHNVMNTDAVAAVSDAATDALNLLFNMPAGRQYLQERRGVAPALADALSSIGLSGICNLLAAVKVAKYYQFGAGDLVVTVATDGAAMYRSEAERSLAKRFSGRFEAIDAAEVFGEHVLGNGVEHFRELSRIDRARIFNLGYYTWVEQQGVPFDLFCERREPGFWLGLQTLPPKWDAMIREFNVRTGAATAY
jgi:cysteine synthase